MYGLVLLLAAQTAVAAEISIRSPRLVTGDEGYTLAADFNINFNTRLEEAVNKGVVLFFAVDFELTRSRWYWFDEKVVRRSRTFQLSYHALTRQYRLSTGGLHQTYDTLEDALRILSRLRNWQVLDKGDVRIGQEYLAGVHMRLDLTQMAKTFQVSALASKDWNMSSNWLHWPFTLTEEVPVVGGAEIAPAVPANPPVTAPVTAPPASMPVQGDGR